MKIFVLVTLLLATAATEAYSCERERLNPTEAKIAADVIFQGTVESIQYLDDPVESKLEARIIVSFGVYPNHGKVILVH